MDENDYKSRLNELEYHVLREGGTELAFSGRSIMPGKDGKYHCKLCGSALFDKASKFESGTGWPSFDRALDGAVTEKLDESHGMKRVEILCSKCKSHLGHVFDDGPTATGKRYCTNSVCFE